VVVSRLFFLGFWFYVNLHQVSTCVCEEMEMVSGDGPSSISAPSNSVRESSDTGMA